MAESVKHLSVQGVKWSAAEAVLSRGITFVVGLVIVRILSPTEYGLVGMLAVFMAVSQAFVNSGFSTALVRMTDRTEDDYATAFCFNVAAGVLVYGVMRTKRSAGNPRSESSAPWAMREATLQKRSLAAKVKKSPS